MTGIMTQTAIPAPAQAGREDSPGSRFPARPVATTWPATWQGRQEVHDQLTRPPFALGGYSSRKHRGKGLDTLLSWLEDQPGQTWQQRWMASGADAAGACWRQIPARWLEQRGQLAEWRRIAVSGALIVAICADIVRPSLRWLAARPTGPGALLRNMARTRDRDGFARLRSACGADPQISADTTSRTLYRCANIAAAKGGSVADITIGDLLELLAAETQVSAKPPPGGAACYRMLHILGIFGTSAPATLREARHTGQRTPGELIDRYHLACRPVRDLLVEYLQERQPALDYRSLEAWAYFLGLRFWKDLETHHPGIDSLHLPADVAAAWKERLRTFTKTTTTRDGQRLTVERPRLNYQECLIPVRAFYLDLAQWAAGEPARWGPWVAPCPIKDGEVARRKARHRLKSRIDARTRERLPVLPVLVRSVTEQRNTAKAMLDAARNTPPGATFTHAEQTLTRLMVKRPTLPAGKIWAHDPATGTRRDLTLEEDHAFWAWATVEILRLTGIRIEELLQLSHHSLVQYRLPSTGELVPLLQIAPSKTDAERLLLVSPQCADVLSAIIQRGRDQTAKLPLVTGYDLHERAFLPPAPLLFQRRHGSENTAIGPDFIRNILTAALQETGLKDASGAPLRYTPHDFRRIFITDAILSGLPPHIAQVIAGHRDINVTLSYKATYPDESIQAHLAFLARRRALRPSEEYRVPTDDEWEQFLGHFVLCTCQVRRLPCCWVSARIWVPLAGRMAGMPRSMGAMRESRRVSSRFCRRKASVRSTPSISPSHPSASARARRARRSTSISSSRGSILGLMVSMGHLRQACSCWQGAE
ncbi:MAG: tyrosine-type recombinase/integrase [Micromonosporaceae bacterium]